MKEEGPYLHKRSNERLRYAVDVCHKAVNDAFKIFSLGKRPYHQLFSDVCQDINAQLDTLNLLIQPLLEAAPKYDFEGVEGNGIRSVLGVVDSILKELISHLQYCSDKHNSFFFNGTNCAAKLARFCALLSRLGKLLDIATLMHQHLGGKGYFLEVSNPVGALCMREFEGISRECFYGQLVGLHYTPSIRKIMKGICVALSSYGIGYYTDVPNLLGQPQSLLWRGSASVISGAKFWFKEEERSRKFVELTHNCASIDFTKSFWNLVDNGPLAEVPRMVNKEVDIAVEIYIEGEPLYVRNKYNQMILMHPPVGNKGHAGVTVGFLSSRFREGQERLLETKFHSKVAAPPSLDPDIPPPSRFPKSKRLLVHFHGGGFVSGSHVQHEAYLRGWCRELDAVVVSINYALAPDNPFPKGLDDCIFAYAWCLENLHTLGCTGKSIVFMGDSAGGNLAIATAMRANSYGLRPPDGILAAYPVTYVKYAGSVSRLLSTLDILLPSGVLQCCLRAYSGVPVDSNNGFCEWMQTAHHPTLPQKTDNHQTISELNSKYISDICGKMPKYTIPAAAEMPSFSTPDTTPEPVGPTPQPDTTPEPVGPTPQPDTTYAITTPDSSPDPLATTSVDYTTSPENHIPSDSNISPSDDVTIELPILSSDPTLVIEETTVSKVEQFNFSSVQDDYEGVDSEDEVVELDTIRINPIVFDNTLTNSPGYNTFNSDIVVEHEVVADAEDRIIINESYDNIENSVVEGDINDIVSESHTALDADSNSCENSGLVIEAHSSYVLLDEQKEGKINESDNGHVEMETENSEQVVENKKSEQVVEDEHPEHAVEDEQAEQVAENELSEQVVENEHPEQVVENEHPEQVVENGDSEYDLVESKNAPENELDDTQEVGEETDESAEKSKLDNVECEVAEAPEIKQVKEVQENAESEVTETQENVQSEVTETLEDLQSEVTETQGDVQPEVMNDHVQEAVLDNDSQQNSLADELVSSEETNEGAAGAGAEGAAGAAGGSGAAGAAGGSGASGAEGAALALIEIAEEEIADEIGESAEDKTSLTSRNSLDFANKHDDKDLEKMLYEDNETRFKGAKLVLTPNHQESKTAPTTPATPVTPGKKLKEATVVRDYDATLDVYPEPAYVINPGEIATRKNATLLQKYFDDPFMSPYLADPETLAALPPIHVVSAEYDPLLDDSIAFCRKVKEAGGEVSLEIVPGMTHGFLNLVLSSKACADAGKLCLVAVSKMFDRGEEK